MEGVDEAFIQAPEHRLTASDPADPGEIPVIDLSHLADPNNIPKITSEIRNACETWGFFQVINHGVPPEIRERIEKAAKEFFDLTAEEKRKVKRNDVNPMGYHDEEHTKNIRDWKEVFDFFLRDPAIIPASPVPEDTALRTLSNRWPQYPSHFRSASQDYANEMEKLAFKLLELLSLSLGLASDRLTGYFKEQTSFMRINHYPPCPQPELALGVGRHTDGGVFTILAQDDVGGLQVKRRSDGKWFPVRPVPGALITNVGNCMQVWTNDKYWSAEHRVVVNTTKERFSMPFFFFTSHYVNIKPLEELLSDQNSSKYKEYNWGKFYVSRNRSDFKKLEVENIQIDHFKVSE